MAGMAASRAVACRWWDRVNARRLFKIAQLLWIFAARRL